MCLDRGGLAISLAFENDLVEVIDRVQVKVAEFACARLDVTRPGNVAREDRLAVARLEGRLELGRRVVGLGRGG